MRLGVRNHRPNLYSGISNCASGHGTTGDGAAVPSGLGCCSSSLDFLVKDLQLAQVIVLVRKEADDSRFPMESLKSSNAFELI
mmetsp:Transcript_36747/g.147001  ORF Transcript_36747/g.147001 Transcript_36747/m.147001 type:complete len:83 (+) Transcript_36747:2947-3195(+)